MKIEIPDLTGAECGDIAITAVEGGINYWAHVSGYDYRTFTSPDGFGDTIDVPDDFIFYRLTCENPYAEGDLIVAITPAMIREGVDIMLNLGKVRKDLSDQLISCLMDKEPGAVDADVADCIIQFSIFGEIVFG